MTLFYYLHTVEEDYKHQTWKFMMTDHIYNGNIIATSQEGWEKQKMPKNLTKEEQLDWFIISNNEDLHFINKEREACTQWHMNQLTDILLAQKENRKLKQHYGNSI